MGRRTGRCFFSFCLDKRYLFSGDSLKCDTNNTGLTGIDRIARLYHHAADSTVLQSALSKMSGLSNGDYAMTAKAAMEEVQGTSAINDLLTGIGNNPEFAGYATKTTVNAELCLA